MSDLYCFCLFSYLFIFPVGQYLKNDLMRQFDSQVNDFMDSLIEESATLEPAPLPAVFSPPLSDKERNKLRCCHFTHPRNVFSLLLLMDVTVFCAGIFDLLMAKASSLWVAGPSWSKSAGGSEGAIDAVFPSEDSVSECLFLDISLNHLTSCCWCFLQWAVWGEPHQDYLPHVYCPAHSLHPQHPRGWFHWWRKVSEDQEYCL